MLERIESNKEFLSFKLKNPFIAKVLKNDLLVKEDCEDDIRHIVLDLGQSDFKHVNGQSIGIIPKGIDEKGKAYKQRIYSIASSELGDDGKRNSLSLCVKRANTLDDKGILHKGVCSNYLCDLKVGDEVSCTGALGRALMLPKDEKTNLILLATGTGIAPMRGFINYIYNDKKSWTGEIDFYFGGKRYDEALYMNDINSEISKLNNPNITMNTHFAFSREMQNKNAGRMYIQDKIQENIENIWSKFENENFAVYICGLKGIEQGLDDVFIPYAKSKNKDWLEMKKSFKKNKRWNVEVY